MAANPTLLSMPIAENGTKNMIPENQATPGNGLMSQSTGFPAECSLPLGAGGVAPDRADFNGAFNLLGGVAFMAQKGFTFNYDATQDYYAGCVVMDSGNRYLCIADITAGTVAPSADTTHDYWIFYPVGVINKRDVVTTSGTYTAPVTGWYKITAKGGGEGGSAGSFSTNLLSTGAGGAEGGTTIAYEFMAAADTASVVIGAGGSGGVNQGAGAAGGDTSVTVNANTYTGGGGGKVNALQGGTGTIPGAPAGSRDQMYYTGNGLGIASNGGGNGGGLGGFGAQAGSAGINGGGGGGGSCKTNPNASYAGGAGGDGYAWFEYFAEV